MAASRDGEPDLGNRDLIVIGGSAGAVAGLRAAFARFAPATPRSADPFVGAPSAPASDPFGKGEAKRTPDGKVQL